MTYLPDVGILVGRAAHNVHPIRTEVSPHVEGLHCVAPELRHGGQIWVHHVVQVVRPAGHCHQKAGACGGNSE